MRRTVSSVVLLALVACGPSEPTRFASVSLELRPDSPASEETFRFDDDEVVERIDTARVRVHFTRSGRNAVPLVDGDASGVPDYPELVATRYEDYLAQYEALGFRAPVSDADLADDNGGDGRFDVYLIDFFGRADGAFQTDACTNTCVGYAVQENDFAGYGYTSVDVATRILATHELFHAVQSSYDAGQDGIFREGTAVWATEALEPELDDFERFIRGYLERPDRPLNRPSSGVVLDPFNYGAALFFRFLTERFDDADFVRRLLVRVEDGAGGVDDPEWDEALDTLLAEDFDATLSDVFVEFALWNVFTGPRSDRSPGVGYAEAARYPPVTTEVARLPFVDERPRHMQLATRYYELEAGERDAVEVRLVGDASELEMWLVIDGAAEARVVSGSTVARARLDPGDTVIVAVVNPRHEGPSRRASLCAGTPDEAARCARDLTDTDEPPPADDDPPDDEPEPPTNPPPSPGPGSEVAAPEGGCRSAPSLQLGSLLVIGALFLVGRKPRRLPRRRKHPAVGSSERARASRGPTRGSDAGPVPARSRGLRRRRLGRGR